MLILILAEAALETVPKEIQNHPAVLKLARSRGKSPGEILLDRSYHHAAMLRLKDGGKRGRPDLVHFALLEASSTPLYLDDHVTVLVHTYGDYTIQLGRRIRLPKSYFRFEGLMEKLFQEEFVGSRQQPLLTLKRQRFDQLISETKPTLKLGLSRIGAKNTFEGVAEILSQQRLPLVVVGTFPRGHFSRHVSDHLDATYSIHSYGLEAHVVIARLLYDFEKVTHSWH